MLSQLGRRTSPEWNIRLDQHLPSNPARLNQHLPSDQTRLDQHIPSNPIRLDQHLPSKETRLDQHLPSNQSRQNQHLPSNQIRLKPTTKSVIPKVNTSVLKKDSIQLQHSGDPALRAGSRRILRLTSKMKIVWFSYSWDAKFCDSPHVMRDLPSIEVE